MRPNVDIPWSIHGKIKDHAQSANKTIEEVYIETLRYGTEHLPEPRQQDDLQWGDFWLSFGPRLIPTQGEESHEINNITTCLTWLREPNTPVCFQTYRGRLADENIESTLARFDNALNGRTDDFFTLHQIGGAWIGRGVKNFAHALKTAENRFKDAGFPTYKTGVAIYIAELDRGEDYVVIRAEINRMDGSIKDYRAAFITDGYPVDPSRYLEIARSLGFTNVTNATPCRLPTLSTNFDETHDVEVIDMVVRSETRAGEPIVGGLIIANPFQNDPSLLEELIAASPAAHDHLDDPGVEIEEVLNYDHLYCELPDHHPQSEPETYELKGASVQDVTPAFDREYVWNIDLSVNW